MSRRLLVTLFSALLISVDASAHPTMGVDISNAALENLITAAPLPDLDGGGTKITPQFGFIKTDLINKPGVTDTTSPKPDYSGSAKGNSAGLGVTFAPKGDLGFFVYATGAQQKGEFEINYSDGTKVEYTDFKSKGTTLVAAAQYRLIGDDQSVFALGVLAGPGFYSFESSLVYNQIGGPTPTKVTFDPSGLGLLTGLQMIFRLGNFRINPYTIGFTNIGDKCHKVALTEGTQLSDSSFKCGEKQGYSNVPGGFGGLGIALGYKSFRFNVYNYQPAQDIRPIKVTSYSLSWGIEI